MKRVTLEIQYADNRTEMRQLEDGSYVIGRDSGDIALHDSVVSGRHGELKVSGTQVVYTDQGSTNGSFTLDGKKVTAPIRMAAGTGFKVGECKIILKAIHQPTARTAFQPATNARRKGPAKTILGQPAPSLGFQRAASPSPAAAVQATAPTAAQPSVVPAAKASPVPRAQPASVPAAKPASVPAAKPASVPAAQPASVPAARPASVPAVQPASVPASSSSAAPPTVASPSLPAAPPQEEKNEPASPLDALVPAPETAMASNAPNDSAGNNDFSYGNSNSSGNNGFSYNMSLGELFNAPMKDAGWIVKFLIMGLISCIPIIGVLNLWGWLIAYYTNRKQGIEELPPAGLSYIGAGVKLLIAYLPIIAAYVVVNIVLMILIMIVPFLFFLSPIVYLALGTVLFLASPAIMYLTIEKDVKLASMKHKEIIAFAKSNTQAYGQLLLAFFIAMLVSGAGGIVFVGMLLTIPFGTAMQAVILAEIKE